MGFIISGMKEHVKKIVICERKRKGNPTTQAGLVHCLGVLGHLGGGPGPQVRDECTFGKMGFIIILLRYFIEFYCDQSFYH